MSLPQRFIDKYTVTESGCWMWTGACTRNGYAQIWDGRRVVLAHRYAYEQLVGPIPVGLEIDHLCRNRACVNPAHLEPVTRRENVLRGIGPSLVGARLAAQNIARGAAMTHCPHGHEYTEANTYRRPAGHRGCRTCIRRRIRDYKQRLKEAARA